MPRIFRLSFLHCFFLSLAVESLFRQASIAHWSSVSVYQLIRVDSFSWSACFSLSKAVTSFVFVKEPFVAILAWYKAFFSDCYSTLWSREQFYSNKKKIRRKRNIDIDESRLNTHQFISQVLKMICLPSHYQHRFLKERFCCGFSFYFWAGKVCISIAILNSKALLKQRLRFMCYSSPRISYLMKMQPILWNFCKW